MPCKIKTILQARRVIDDGDMLLRRALPSDATASLGPFVFFDHYAHVSRRGLGDRPHPHAGIEVISYLLEGSMHHRDSMGFSDRIHAGEVQVISSGRGMLHAEVPDGRRHGLQLWTSLPPQRKGTAPSYRRFAAKEMPQACSQGTRLRVISGTVNALIGPLELARPTVLAHASLEGARRLDLSAEPSELGLYMLAGRLHAGSHQPLIAGDLAILSEGNEIELHALDHGAEVLILGGQSIDEEIFFSGPFVMDTLERLQRAHTDYRTGAMGTLDGVPF